jgi:putative FmdB family regulatory protein
MPIYVYHCPSCGSFESSQKFSDTPLEECPVCRGRVHRVPQIAHVIYKTTGFTTTDKRFDQDDV